MNLLISKFSDLSAVIGVVGLGYVGLPLALQFVKAGYSVVGFDISEDLVERLCSGQSHIKHISSDVVADAVASNLSITSDFSNVANIDAIIICVPTPLNKYREPDISYVVNTIKEIVPYLRPNQVISLESTTYPGTTEEELFPRIYAAGFEVGKDVFLIYSPEREDPGNKNFTTYNIPKLIGGFTPNCTKVGLKLYERAIKKLVPLSSTRAAEFTKLLENIHRAVNIGLVNELKIVADRMGINIIEAIDAAATKPFGFTPYYPGPGLGGHCIPIDPFYLTWKAREYGLHTHFIELAGEINASMPYWVVSKLQDSLNNLQKSLHGSNILVVGVSYKKNIDDARESPSIKLMELLVDKGANVEYHDPYFPKFPVMRDYYFDLESVVLSETKIAKYDAIVISTDHDGVDYDAMQKSGVLIVDTRAVYKNEYTNVIKA